MPEVTLSIPAKAEYAHVLRAVLASVAAKQDLSVDSIDDLRLAGDEAAAYLLRLFPLAEKLDMSAEVTGGRLVIMVSAASDSQDWPPPDSSNDLAWKVISGLTDEAAFDLNGADPAIRMVKRL